VDVPVQILAPEVNPVCPDEAKKYAWETIINTKSMFDYQHFPRRGACFLHEGL
jgi:hypothetical protein